MKSTARLVFYSVFCLCLLAQVYGQQQQASPAAPKSGEKTVEEAYLQESIETTIIREQVMADSRDIKLVALQYAKNAIDNGRTNDEIRKSLEYLALETTAVSVRSGGYGRPINDFPDVRAAACDYLAEFPGPESKDALIKVALADAEPMVLSAAVRSLGKIGLNENDEVTQVIAFLVKRYDLLRPDNSLAFECLVALERIASKNKGLKDPLAIRAVMSIATGNYIPPVRMKAAEMLNTMRGQSSGSGTKK